MKINYEKGSTTYSNYTEVMYIYGVTDLNELKSKLEELGLTYFEHHNGDIIINEIIGD